MISNITVLIADDTSTDRLILEKIIRKEGHNVIAVPDGKQALEAFNLHKPDLVLLDVVMPHMDGIAVAKAIRQLLGKDFVPIIFLTSLTDTESLVKCLEAGGDDFLPKPYNRVILQAKIKAFMRMREMHLEVQAQRDQIADHNQHLMQEQLVAKHVFDNIAHTGCLDQTHVKYSLSPLSIFNGDVIVAARRPSGNMMVLLGDFTGHGLPAAIGAMPLATCFYGMVKKGFTISDILREINQKLKQILPVGVFCCAAMVDMSFAQRKIKVWNGGLPACILQRAGTGATESITSTHLPLGVMEDYDFKDDCVHLEMELGDRFYMWSDGILESRNSSGEMFGENRLLDLFQQSKGASLFDQLLDAAAEFSGGERDDDLSLVELTMTEEEDIQEDDRNLVTQRYGGLMEWSCQFEILPSTFKQFNPLPLLLNILIEVPGLRPHGGTLHTLLAELYSNALEHGILGLCSSMKDSPEGFSNYYTERSARLERLTEGYICFSLSHQITDEGGELMIHVEDSGPGFDYSSVMGASVMDEDGYCGRGFTLIRSMCKSLRFLGKGNRVEAVFQWDMFE